MGVNFHLRKSENFARIIVYGNKKSADKTADFGRIDSGRSEKPCLIREIMFHMVIMEFVL